MGFSSAVGTSIEEATQPSVIGVSETDREAWYGAGKPKLGVSKAGAGSDSPINPIPTIDDNVVASVTQPERPEMNAARGTQSSGLFETPLEEEEGKGNLRRNAFLGITALAIMVGATYSLRILNSDTGVNADHPLIATATISDLTDPASAIHADGGGPVTTQSDRVVYGSEDLQRMDIISSDIGPSNALGIERPGSAPGLTLNGNGVSGIKSENQAASATLVETSSAKVGDAIQITDLSDQITQPVTLEEAARDGNPVAAYQLGLAKLARGQRRAGFGHLLSAAEAGLAAAQYQVARAYETGEGVEKDLLQARKWTQAAAEGGNRGAMHNLAVFFAEGGTSDSFYARAASWFMKAAQAGLPDSQFNLAILYENGFGVPRDLRQAYYWLQVAALNGDHAATARAAQIAQAIDETARIEAEKEARAFRPKALDREANGVFGQQPWDTDRPLSSAEVTELQQRLIGYGYEIGGVDGSVGPKTRAAIKAFQERSGLRPTGAATMSALQALRSSNS